jgi:hypothetical protein
MVFSGTTSFAPSVGELVLNSYGRIQLRGPALVAQHFYDARIEGNLLQIEWQNKGVQLWTVDLQSIPLVQGTASYSVPSNTMAILDVYVEVISGNQPIDRPILGISRSDYAAQANKTVPGAPTTWWFDRLIAPTITLWPVPDGSQSYTLKYYRYRLIQDAILAGGIQPEMPIRWLDAFSAGLAHRLARLHAPALEALRKVDAEEAWRIASTQDQENVPIRILPQLATYYRRGR